MGPGRIDWFYDSIVAQPRALRDVIKRHEQANELADWGSEWRHRERPFIVLAGMGASLFAAEAIAVGLVREGIAARAIAVSELLDYELNGLPSETFIVAVSQSGESAEIKALLQKVPAESLYAITNRDDSTLGRRCRRTAVLGVPPDRSVAITTYTASLAILQLLATHLTAPDGKAVAGQVTALAKTADEIKRLLPVWEAQVRELALRLKGVHSIYLVGWGSGVASAREAALLLKEGARTPSEAMSSAMFRHGAVEVLDERFAVVFFMNDQGDPSREDAWAYVAELLQLRSQVIVIGHDIPSDLSSPWLFEIDAGDATARTVISEIIPIQLLAWRIAQERGFEAGVFRNTSPVVSRPPIRRAVRTSEGGVP